MATLKTVAPPPERPTAKLWRRAPPAVMEEAAAAVGDDGSSECADLSRVGAYTSSCWSLGVVAAGAAGAAVGVTAGAADI